MSRRRAASGGASSRRNGATRGSASDERKVGVLRGRGPVACQSQSNVETSPIERPHAVLDVSALWAGSAPAEFRAMRVVSEGRENLLSVDEHSRRPFRQTDSARRKLHGSCVCLPLARYPRTSAVGRSSLVSRHTSTSANTTPALGRNAHH